MITVYSNLNLNQQSNQATNLVYESTVFDENIYE